MIAKLSTTPVFDWNYRSNARIRINQGGTSSGKTYAILQVIFLLLTEKKRIAQVIGQDIPNLKSGALRDFQERILPASPWMNSFIQTYNASERRYRFTNGSILEFVSFSDEQDAKSGKRDIAFFNEANGIAWPIYFQVSIRTTETIFIDYNPTTDFWVHDRVMNDPKAVTFYSNFTHNPFADQAIIDDLRQLQKIDPESWKVYGLGMTGAVGELMIDHVTIIDDMPSALKFPGYGLDFGYRSDPTTMIYCGQHNEDLYFDEVFFAYRMKTPDIDARMTSEGVRRNLVIWADAAESRVIDDLSAMRWNIHGADKGPGSVMYGVKLLNSYNMFITSRSVNMIAEQKKYRRRTDKTGKILDEPVKAFDHTWDAARYWAMMNIRPAIQKQRKGVRRVN